MSIEGNTTGQIVDFGQVAAVQAAQVMSLIVTVNLDALTSIEGGNIAVIANNYNSPPVNGWNLTTFNSTTRLEFISRSGGGTIGEWFIASPGLGAVKQIGISYDGSNAANDPTFYVNGAPVSTVLTIRPSGAMVLTGTEFSLLGRNDSAIAKTQTLDGQILQFMLFNRILPAAYFEEAYAAREYMPSFMPVFNARLFGAAGIQNAEGAALAAGNTIVDEINGALGVPSGLPILHADAWMTVSGVF